MTRYSASPPIPARLTDHRRASTCLVLGAVDRPDGLKLWVRITTGKHPHYYQGENLWLDHLDVTLRPMKLPLFPEFWKMVLVPHK